MNKPVLEHPFERAGLGIAPFRYAGFDTRRIVHPDGSTQCGAGCDYCGTGIVNVFFVRSSDGRKFKVGSDCILKLGIEVEAEIATAVRREMARIQREQREARAEIRREREWKQRVAFTERITARLAADPALLTNRPHPNEWHASQGKTYRDYIEFCVSAGGGGVALLKRIACEVEAAL